MIRSILILLLALSTDCCDAADQNPLLPPRYVGCFKDGPNHEGFSLITNRSQDNVENCVVECFKNYFKYAAIQNALLCLCSGTHEPLAETEEESCDKPCLLNITQICGGESHNSLYETGRSVSGPPAFLAVTDVTQTSMNVTWESPKAPNGVIEGYTVKAVMIKSYSSMSLFSEMTWTHPASTRHADVLDLHPGSTYSIKVCAIVEAKCGVPSERIAETDIGCPDVPREPKIISRDNSRGLITVNLPRGASHNGPITNYRIIVSSGLAEVSSQYLDSFENAEAKGLSYYITAELPPEAADTNFTIGDKSKIGGFFNAPLPEDQDIHVTLGVGSSRNNHSCFSYSSSQSYLLDKKEGPSSNLEEGLIVAIVVCSVLLVLVILAYFIARRLAPQRRRVTRIEDPQEMCLQGPMIEVENFGYIPEEEELNKTDHYDHLKKVLWDIPRNFLDILSHETVGNGSFGSVVKGSVIQNGFPVPTIVHCIEDERLSATTKRSMLQELGLVVRCGTVNHSNVIRLIGTCETPDMLYIVLEYHPASLKDMLLESRTLERPVHERDLSRVCSLPQQAFLQIAVGIAQGMGHLARNKVVHKQLCASSVLMADGMVPKISNFGIAKFNRPHVTLDFTRWTAREVFRSQHYTVKSDVWSMGCLLWEMAALGGTPYNNLPTSEVAYRVMRGIRLPQMAYVTDELYQLMLQCWQLDLDERPTFDEIATILCELIDSGEPHLDWSIMPGFRYEQYLPNFEQVPQ